MPDALRSSLRTCLTARSPFRIAVVGAALAVAGAAIAGVCDTTCPLGATQENDGCGDVLPDPNGGCNLPGSPFQDLGSITLGGSVVACGTVGAIGDGSRDLDWYHFDIPQAGFVTVSVTNQDSVGNPAPNIVLFLRDGALCDGSAITLFAQASALCPFTTPQFAMPPGQHTVIVSVDSFEAPLCPVEYTLTVSFEPGAFAECGAAGAGSCVEAHGGLGCNNFACCEEVCAFFAPCCQLGWDADCVDFAVGLCGLFLYQCNSPGGAPPNDCATAATTANLDVDIAFNNSVADTDGPEQTCPQNRDLWWKVQAPTDGELISTVTAPGLSHVISIYSLPPGGILEPTELPNQFIGCVTLGAGGGGVRLLGVDAGDWFLYRVGSAGATAGGAGTLRFELEQYIFNTGGTQTVLFNGVGTNLGLSSGNLGVGSEQRWFATPFTVAAPGAPNAWDVTRIYAYGFSPAGVQNDTLEWIIWDRTSLDAPPVDGDQVVSGSVAFPTPTELPEGAPANEQHTIVTDFVLQPGDYWLTVFASNATGGTVPSNFAWFVNPPDGIVNLDRNGNPHGWRSFQFPAPGFVFYQAAAIQPQPGADPTTIYNTGFRIVGSPTTAGTPPCTGNLNGDGSVDGADLGILLQSWGPNPGSPSDLNGDGSVDGADLGILLQAWGPCP